ncbi:MAG: hypothetical protein K2R98_16290 [Gemmataceae bacterium]|nr:hypothetical protein [Gemmataceae bacterium]
MDPTPSFDAAMPPWEQPEAVRRDLPPHRAEILSFLASASMVCASVSSCLFFLGIVGVGFGLVTVELAKRDLDRMGQGLLDPSGQEQTTRALARGERGIVTSLCFIAIWMLLGIVVGMILTPRN